MQITAMSPQPAWADKVTERVFEVDTGRLDLSGDPVVLTVAVKVTRKEQSAEQVAAKAIGRVVDPATGAAETVDGAEAIGPARVHTIVMHPGESGAAAVERERARATTEAIERAINHREALLAWARLPAEPQ